MNIHAMYNTSEGLVAGVAGAVVSASDQVFRHSLILPGGEELPSNSDPTFEPRFRLVYRSLLDQIVGTPLPHDGWNVAIAGNRAVVIPRETTLQTTHYGGILDASCGLERNAMWLVYALLKTGVEITEEASQ